MIDDILNSSALNCIAAILLVVISLRVFGFFGEKHERLSEKATTRIVKVNTAEGLDAALGDILHSRMGQDTLYVITDRARRDMKNWNYSDKLNVELALRKQYDRLDLNGTTMDDLRNDE